MAIQTMMWWPIHQRAFSEMLSATSTKWAPWYVIPADRKWFARICVSAVLAHTLMEIDPHFPVLDDAAREQLLVARGQLEAEGPDSDEPEPGHGQSDSASSAGSGGPTGAVVGAGGNGAHAGVPVPRTE